MKTLDCQTEVRLLGLPTPHFASLFGFIQAMIILIKKVLDFPFIQVGRKTLTSFFSFFFPPSILHSGSWELNPFQVSRIRP